MNGNMPQYQSKFLTYSTSALRFAIVDGDENDWKSCITVWLARSET